MDGARLILGLPVRAPATPSAVPRPARVSSHAYAGGIICGVLATALWGGGAVVSRHLVTAGLDPADLVFLRYAGCLPLALLFALGGAGRPRTSLSWSRLAALIVLAGPLYQVLVFAGYRYASAAGGALLLTALLPVSALLLRSALTQSLPRAGSLVACLAVIGGLGVFAGPDISGLSGLAVAIFALAAMLWAVLNELVGRWRLRPLELAVILSLSSILFLPLYLLTAKPAGLATVSLHDLALQVVYHGWLVAFLATALFFAAVRMAGPELAASLQTLAPVFSAAFGAAFLGEALALEQGAGTAVTLLGVLAMVRSSRECVIVGRSNGPGGQRFRTKSSVPHSLDGSAVVSWKTAAERPAMSTKPPCLIAVDWGTSNFRAYLVDADGRILGEERSGEGILAVGPEGFAGVLAARVGGWLQGRRDLPVVLSGMIGSRQGWVEAPYARCPASVVDLGRALVFIDAPGVGRVAVIPGVDHIAEDGVPDVMRGEEVQVLGALAADEHDDLFVHPGTHSKWVTVSNRRITSFATYMTGETFAALKTHTILGRLMSDRAGDGAGAGFASGVEASRGETAPMGTLLHRLFSVRTLGLFDRLPATELSDYLSGLLIGAELVAAATPGMPITLLGGGELTSRYSEAATLLGIPWKRGPANSVISGQLQIARSAGLIAPE